MKHCNKDGATAVGVQNTVYGVFFRIFSTSTLATDAKHRVKFAFYLPSDTGTTHNTSQQHSTTQRPSTQHSTIMTETERTSPRGNRSTWKEIIVLYCFAICCAGT